MDRFVGKVAVVTGASSGIGAQIATDLVKAGMQVVGLARREEKIQEIAKNLLSAKGKLHALQTDVTSEADILKAFAWIEEHLGPVHVLVNNAGVHNFDKLMDGTTEGWKKVFDTNVMSLNISTREAIRIMNKHQIEGHIIHINSVAGHAITKGFHGMYQASKHAVTALTGTLRWELVDAGSKIKITSVSPGLVVSEMTDKLRDRMPDMPSLNAEDISSAVLYAIGTPPHVQIHEMIIKPVGEYTC